MGRKRVFSQNVARRLNANVARFVPHSFLFPVLFTFIIYLLGIFVAYQGPFDMIQFWVKGFWNFLSFSMQMVLMVVAAFSVAGSPIGQKILRSLAGLPKTPTGGIVFMVLMVSAVSWFFWGFGMVVGIFLAREMGRRIPRIDYPILVASAYIGMCAGTFGCFASEPLAISKGGHFLEKAIGIIPLGQTSFSTMTLMGVGLGTVLVAAFMGLICPEGKDATPTEAEVLKRFDEEDYAEMVSLSAEKELLQKGDLPFGVWLEHRRWPVWLISILGFSYICYWFYVRGFEIDLNILNFSLLFLALFLHDTPMRFLKSMERSTRVAYGIIVQFPFYAGIQGMMSLSGLGAILFGWITSLATEATLPFWVYVDAAFVNLFLPTSMGIWEVQGPLVVKLAEGLNASVPRAINAFTGGEVIGNAIQPFWAIPLLAICSLPMRLIMGYCLMAFLVLSVVWILCVTLLPI